MEFRANDTNMKTANVYSFNTISSLKFKLRINRLGGIFYIGKDTKNFMFVYCSHLS